MEKRIEEKWNYGNVNNWAGKCKENLQYTQQGLQGEIQQRVYVPMGHKAKLNSDSKVGIYCRTPRRKWQASLRATPSWSFEFGIFFFFKGEEGRARIIIVSGVQGVSGLWFLGQVVLTWAC